MANAVNESLTRRLIFFMQFRLLGQAHCKMSMFSVESASACRNVVVSYSIQTACLIKNLNRMEPQMENGMNVLRNISHSVRRSASSLLLTAHRPSTLCQHFHLACPTATITQIHSRQMTVYLARFLAMAIDGKYSRNRAAVFCFISFLIRSIENRWDVRCALTAKKKQKNRPSASRLAQRLVDFANENDWRIKCAILFTAQFVAFLHLFCCLGWTSTHATRLRLIHIQFNRWRRFVSAVSVCDLETIAFFRSFPHRGTRELRFYSLSFIIVDRFSEMRSHRRRPNRMFRPNSIRMHHAIIHHFHFSIFSHCRGPPFNRIILGELLNN